MKDKGFHVLTGFLMAVILLLFAITALFKSHASDLNTTIKRSSVICYSGGRVIFSDTIDGETIYSTNSVNMISYRKEGIQIRINADCIVTEFNVDENIRKKEEEYFKKSKTRKDIKAELEKDSSQFE